GNVHHVLRLRRRAAGVRPGATHLPPRDGAQLVPPLVLRARQLRRVFPAAGHPVPGVRGDHVLRRGPRRRGRCFARGVQMFEGTPIAGMTEAVKLKVLGAISATLGTNMTAATCVVTGADVLRQQAVTDLGKWMCLLVTAAFGFFFRALFYVVLLVGSKNKRK
uniref:Uncharacterized protein n=1 Tax=Aegilops tauschii subsp. strangulata TaxID=200361 RepID=A0A453JXW6_AEGTS